MSKMLKCYIIGITNFKPLSVIPAMTLVSFVGYLLIQWAAVKTNDRETIFYENS